MEQIAITKSIGQDTWTSSLNQVELADDNKRAILTVPLMHVGANSKGLYWTAELLKEIAYMFQDIPFRYDLDGQEGSSHATKKLSSPHFDVGWTYSGNEGAWYDTKTKTLWVKGEVTHPQVIQKLERQTTDGKREVNYASMGVIVDEAKCSICGTDYENGVEPKCEHERLKAYNGERAYKVPTKVSKALHAALTNDPADGEAEITNCIFQELGGNNMLGQDYRMQSGTQQPNLNHSQMQGGMAPSSPQTGQPGSSPSAETILRDLAERIKTVENKLGQNAMQEGTPEVVNAAPQDQMVQDNMGTTDQFKVMEAKKMDEMKSDPKMGQNSQEKTALNPSKPEVQDMGAPVGMDQVMQVLQQILAAVSGNQQVATQDMGKESMDANKGIIKHDETKPTEHMAPGDAVTNSEDEGNKKNKQHMNEPGKVATADNEEEDEEPEEEDLKEEVADMKKKMKAMAKKLELQDNEVPEFGGSNNSGKSLDVADMSASQRAKEFGDFGKYDAIFNGAKSASRFKQ